MKLELYYAPTACSMVPFICMTEAGAPFDVKPINLGKGQHMTPEYLKINPKHKVPMLVVDGKSLTENVAIQQFLARKFPQAKLLPADLWQEMQAVSIMSWCSGGIHPYLSRIHSPGKVCDVPGTENSVKALSAAAAGECIAIANEMLAGREFFFDHFTAADAHFFWCFRRAGQLGVDLSKFTNCQAHFERMKERASVQKLLAFEADVMGQFAKAA